jgi:hypothetical protein
MESNIVNSPISGADLLDLLDNEERVYLSMIPTSWLWQNKAVLIGNTLYVSKAACELIKEDPGTRNEVFKGLSIVVIQEELSIDMLGIEFYNSKPL